MNIRQFVPRKDCKAFAKCENKSLSHCRRYRGEDEECKTCTLIRRKPRNRMYDSHGVEMKMCARCGKYLYLNRFYNITVTTYGKKYHCLSSWCRMCTSESNRRTNSKSKKQ